MLGYLPRERGASNRRNLRGQSSPCLESFGPLPAEGLDRQTGQRPRVVAEERASIRRRSAKAGMGNGDLYIYIPSPTPDPAQYDPELSRLSSFPIAQQYVCQMDAMQEWIAGATEEDKSTWIRAYELTSDTFNPI